MSISVFARQLEAVSREMETLSLRSSLSSQEDRRMTYLTSQAATYRSLIAAEKETRVSQSTKEEDRAILRSILSNREGGEYRTYSPMVSAGSQFVPQSFVDVLAEAQMSAGPLYAGSPAVSNLYATQGSTGPAKLPTQDDTASTGFEIMPEGTAAPDGVFSPSNVTLTLRQWSSGLVQYSMELSQDVAEFDVLAKILASALGNRLSRIQNSTFLASLLTILGSNSSAGSVTSETAGIVTVADIQELLGSVNAAYRQSSKAAFLMNSGTQLALSKLKSTGGITLLPKLLSAKPEIFDFPVFISDFCDDVATDAKPILFGDFSTVYFRSIEGFDIMTLTERFADQGSYALVAKKRSDMKYSIASSSDSAIKYIVVS